MITTTALSFHYPYFLKIQIMTILTRQERERVRGRERFVLELYNQGKTIREIAKEVRMSFRDIGAILNKIVEEKTKGWKEEQQDNTDSVKNQNQEQQQPHLSLSAQACIFFKVVFFTHLFVSFFLSFFKLRHFRSNRLQ
jgi:Trp operon repressor